MSGRPEATALPLWLPVLDLACAAVACGAWYTLPGAGPWPLLLALFPWGLRWALTGRLTVRTGFDLPQVLFLLTAGVAVWTAFDRPAAWAKFWLILGGVLLFYALANAAPLPRLRVWLLALFGGGVAGYFLATHDWEVYPAKIAAFTQVGQAIQARLPGLPGHRLHPNVAGGIVAMLLPFAALAACWSLCAARAPLPEPDPGDGRVRRRRLGWLASAVALALLALMGLALALTTSRGAWIALGSAAALFLIWLATGWLGRRLSLRGGRLFLAVLGVLLVAAAVAAVAWRDALPGLIAAVPGPNTGASRIALLGNTLTLLRDYPILGAGLGGFRMLYSTYALLVHVGHTVHSHNLLLNAAVEQGWLAAALLAWLWIRFAAVTSAAAANRRPSWATADLQKGSEEALAAAALCLAVLFVHGLVDDVLYGSRGVLLLSVPLAFAAPFRRAHKAAWWRSVALPAGLAAALLLALAWRRPLLSRVYSNLGAVHQGRAELSVYCWPEWPLQDAVRRSLDLGRVTGEFEHALALDAGNPTANRRLGMIELSLGGYERALAHLEAARAAEPRSPTTAQLLGEAYLANGRLEEGQALWAGAPNDVGQLDARVFWYGHIGDAERQARMAEAAGGP